MYLYNVMVGYCQSGFIAKRQSSLVREWFQIE